MDNFRLIEQRLRAFIRKFYLNELLKGAILFLAAGLLYFLLTLSIEYFLWLNSLGRKILFWLFIAAEAFFFVAFILIPILKLLKLSGGISETEASKIIGHHFPEVSDKLLNLLQLKKDQKQSELLLASIEQRSRELKPVPFASAVDFRKNLKYLKYAAIPVLIILAIVISGHFDFFQDSYTRVSHYNTAYEPPAPFSFHIENEDLRVQESKDLKLRIKTEGKLLPETVSIHFNDQKYYLKPVSPGVFEFDFRHLDKNLQFHLSSNEVVSRPYEIEVIKVPKLVNFGLKLDYPNYTGRQDEKLEGTGNATVPEGTLVTWNFDTRNTSAVNISSTDSLYRLAQEKGQLNFQKKLRKDFSYTVSTENGEVKDFEPLGFEIGVVKDEYPEIKVQMKKDSLEPEIRYFKGRVSDDYGLRRLRFVYYPEEAKDSAKTLDLGLSGKSVGEFLFTFPGKLKLEKGTNYEMFFEVYDNDGVNGSKKRKSEVFSYREKSVDEEEQEQLQEQGESIKELDQSLEKMKKSGEELKDISRLQKEKEELSYNERRKLEDFMKRQEQQNKLMRNYSEKLKKNFEKAEVNAGQKEYREELKKRLEQNEESLKENEKLLEELKKISEKIGEEDLGEKLEELSKRNTSEQRNLEQLLELTKQYYVQEKARKLAKDLEKLAEKQESLADKSKEENTPDAQEKISDEFEQFQKEMDELEKDNKNLKSPKDLGRDKSEEEKVKQEQKSAEDELQQGQQQKAGQRQKNAAQKMKEMSGNMQSASMAQSAEQLDADIATLRQILDNLIIFSFEQEDLMKDFRNIDNSNPTYSAKLKEENLLKENFRHIDDSLYMLALRNPMINEEITKNLTDVEFELDKSLERLAENEIPQGTASQQYVVTGANNLAYLLSKILGSLQQQANPQAGQGKGQKEFQLPDIIKKQEEIQQQMQEGMQPKSGRKPNEKGQEQSEEGNARLYEIYKQQEELRNQLEELMQKEGATPDGDMLDKQMEQLEKELLNKGFDPDVVKQMDLLKHQLLKFKDARLQQGEDNKRISSTNQKDYENPTQDQNLKAKEYFKSTEILNRQILPLRQIYKQKVKEYFEGRGD